MVHCGTHLGVVKSYENDCIVPRMTLQDAAAVEINSEVMDPFPIFDRKLSLQRDTEIN